jgi:hypothetical protein
VRGVLLEDFRPHPTQYKFRHYRQGKLIWASGLTETDLDEIVRLAEEESTAIICGSDLDRDVVSGQKWTQNELADGGEQDILQVYFRAQTAPTTFHLRLWNDTPVDTDTNATLVNEVTGTGYASQQLTRGATDLGAPALDGGDYMTTSVTKTFTAGGTWSAATQLGMHSTAHTVTSGIFIAWASLSATRTLVNADTLQVSMAVKLG